MINVKLISRDIID